MRGLAPAPVAGRGVFFYVLAASWARVPVPKPAGGPDGTWTMSQKIWRQSSALERNTRLRLGDLWPGDSAQLQRFPTVTKRRRRGLVSADRNLSDSNFILFVVFQHVFLLRQPCLAGIVRGSENVRHKVCALPEVFLQVACLWREAGHVFVKIICRHVSECVANQRLKLMYCTFAFVHRLRWPHKSLDFWWNKACFGGWKNCRLPVFVQSSTLSSSRHQIVGYSRPTGSCSTFQLPSACWSPLDKVHVEQRPGACREVPGTYESLPHWWVRVCGVLICSVRVVGVQFGRYFVSVGVFSPLSAALACQWL